MAITSTITTDNGAQTSTLTILLDGAIEIDKITYSDADQQLTFPDTKNDILLSKTDIAAFLKLIPAFNASLKISFYDLNQPQYQPFNSMCSSLNDDGVSELEFELKREDRDVYLINCDYPNGAANIAKRSNESILSYAEWLYLVYEMANFNLFVSNAYNL